MLHANAMPHHPRTGRPLRVVTFNIRLGIADDGPDSWPHRKPRVAALMQALCPDILAVQEAYDFQLEFLMETLSDFWLEGVGREDGEREGEWSAVLGRRGRLTPAAAGTFWFSDTPDVPGSLGPGARCTRTATWVQIFDDALRVPFTVVNQHWDHESDAARKLAARMLAARLPSLADGRPVVVAGDFNCGEDDPAIGALLEGLPLRNAYREIEVSAPADTFHGFTGEPLPGMIDQILVSSEWRVVAAGVERRRFAGGWPSDHFPVWADIALDGAYPLVDRHADGSRAL